MWQLVIEESYSLLNTYNKQITAKILLLERTFNSECKSQSYYRVLYKIVH